jgi:hypothetical protein
MSHLRKGLWAFCAFLMPAHAPAHPTEIFNYLRKSLRINLARRLLTRFFAASCRLRRPIGRKTRRETLKTPQFWEKPARIGNNMPLAQLGDKKTVSGALCNPSCNFKPLYLSCQNETRPAMAGYIIHV